MYSAAMSPPRWPVPRPSRRSWERKRTWASMLSGRMLCMAAMVAGGRCEPKRDSARGFTGFCCADAAAIGTRTAASTAILRMFTRGLEALVVKEYPRIVNGDRRAGGTHLSILTVVTGRLLGFYAGFCPATAGLVFRASTSAEIADVFSGLKDRREGGLLRGGELAVDVLHFLFDPSDAADFDLAVLSDQEQSRDIGQAVSIGDSVAVRIVEQSAEGNTVLFQKGGGVALVVLRDAHDRDFLVAVRFVHPFEVGQRVLADGAGNLEEGGEYRSWCASGLQ